MPNYLVKKPGFRHGRTYSPQGKRPVLVENIPFTDADGNNPKPSWVGDLIAPPKVDEGPSEEEVLAAKEQVLNEERLQAEREASKSLADREAEGNGDGDAATNVDVDPDAEVDFNVENSEQAEPDQEGTGVTETLGVENA